MNLLPKKYVSIAAGLAVAASVALPAFAQEQRAPSLQVPRGAQPALGRPMGGPRDGSRIPVPANTMMRNSISGIVSSVTGMTVIIDSHRPASTTPASTTAPIAAATTTYTIDASQAVVFKQNATSSVSSIAVGDRLIVSGTISGTSITAKTIIDANIINQRPWGMSSSSPARYENNDGVVDFGFGRGQGNQGQPVGFFGSIGNFFKRMFGFGR